MNTAHHHYRTTGELDTLQTLAAHAPQLDGLSLEDFTLLAEIFRLGPQGAQAGKEVRKVLLEVLLIERDHHAAYLLLPKFRTLPARTTNLIQAYWQHLWTAFTAHRENEPKNKQTAMVPEGVKEMPRVNTAPTGIPFDYYRAYQAFPKFGMEQPKLAYSPFPYYYNFQNYPYAQPYHPHHPPPLPTPAPSSIKLPAPPITTPGPIPINPFYKADPQPEPEAPLHRSDKEKEGEKAEKAGSEKQLGKVQRERRQREKQKDRSKQKEREREKEREKEKAEIALKTELAMKAMDSNSQSKAKSLNKKQQEPPSNKKQPQPLKNQLQLPKKDPRRQREASPPKQPQGPRSNIINLRFLHCACLGHTISTSEKSFQCHQCKNLFHYSCLHLSSSDGKSCPFCTLSRHHAFTEALPRAIKSGWFQVSNKDCFVTKLHLDADEQGTFRKHMALLEKDKENVYAIQFRILRINEKPKIKTGRKIIKSSFPILDNQLRKIEHRHWIQVKLKQITEPSLIFYLMTLIRLKDKTRIHQDYRVLEVTKTPLVDFWAEQEKVAGKKLQVKMTHPVTGKALELPVRGQSCDHLQCEDLLFFYEQYQLSTFDGTNRLQCSHCNKIYTAHSKFTADPVMHALLQTRPPGSKRLRLQNGRVEWIPVESSGSEVEEGEESGSAS